MARMPVSDVFRINGQPTVTYVPRDDGELERLLDCELANKGTICLLSGPSKTGKTTLYTRVLDYRGLAPLKVSCEQGLSAEDVWRQALEAVDFDQIDSLKGASTLESSGGRTGQIKVGWKQLAEATGQLSRTWSKKVTEEECRKRVLSKPSPKHLSPVLQTQNTILVIEDFHRLNSTTKKRVAQQLKGLVDDGVSVIVVATSHHSSDLAHVNPDLLGRVFHIETKNWELDDLTEIVDKGLEYLGLLSAVPPRIRQLIAKESVGLPILTQSACLQILHDNGVREMGDAIDRIRQADIFSSLHRVCNRRYADFNDFHDRFVRGPRKAARKYETYGLILLCFAIDPLAFSLTREEIDTRLGQLPIPGSQVPPASSINNSLKALTNLQKRLERALLEWSPRSRRLHVLEPSFLFYLRWRRLRGAAPSTNEVAMELLNELLESK